MRKGRSDHHQMIKNIFPFIVFFSFVSPSNWTSNGEIFSQLKTLETLSPQSSKILTDFQGKDKMDTQRNESSPRNRINNLKINVLKPLSEIEKKALVSTQNGSRAFLMFVHSVRFCKLCYMPSTALMIGEREISQHLKVDKVIELPSLNIPSEWIEAFNGMMIPSNGMNG
jgi:hypothetical protein